MSAIPILFVTWVVFTACFLALLAYRGTLTRYEDDQLFLNDTIQTEREEQTEIVRKVNRIEPLVNILGGASGVLTVCIVGLYVWDAWKRI